MTARVVAALDAHVGAPATDVLLRRRSLDRQRLTAGGLRVPYDEVDALIELAGDELGDATLAVALLAVRDVETYDAAGLLLLSAPTWGEGITRAFGFQRLWGDGERFVVVHTPDVVTIRFSHPGRSVRARAVLAELALLELTGSLFVLCGARPSAVRFVHRAPRPRPELEGHLGAPPTWSAAENAIDVPRSLWDAPIVVPVGVLARWAESRAASALSALKGPATDADRVRALVLATPPVTTLRDAARALRESPRTLQRRLATTGDTFDALLDRSRRERATELFARGASVKEVSHLVGFADPSALVRARRRWARTPPR